MSLSFLPADIFNAVAHLNLNYVTEIRIRLGQPVIIGYRDEYYFLCDSGVSLSPDNAIIGGDIETIIDRATDGNIFRYSEQMRYGYLTCNHGVRIGLAGEYITQNGDIKTVSSLTSLNIRVPHDINGCALSICKQLFCNTAKSLLIFSKPGLGKTTKLRDIARYLSDNLRLNTLIFDERNEIAAINDHGNGFYVGSRTDVIRAGNKIKAFSNAIRAMKPEVIITDELYGEEDMRAVEYAVNCGLCVVASSHITKHELLKSTPFEYFAELKTLSGQPVIYDKNFVVIGSSGADDIDRRVAVG